MHVFFKSSLKDIFIDFRERKGKREEKTERDKQADIDEKEKHQMVAFGT